MKRKLMSLLLILTVASAFAQDGYPKPIQLNSDTVVAFTQNQVTLINLNKVSFDECKELNVSLEKELKFIRSALNHSRQYEVDMSQKDRKQREIISELDTQIELHEDSNKKLQRKLKTAKILRYVWTGVGVIGGFYLGNKASSVIKL